MVQKIMSGCKKDVPPFCVFVNTSPVTQDNHKQMVGKHVWCFMPQTRFLFYFTHIEVGKIRGY